MASIQPVVQSGDARVFVVTIRINAQGKIETIPPQFKISKRNFDQVLWRSEDPKVTFKIKFGEDSPFAYPDFSNDLPYSGLVRRDVEAPLNCKYTISIEEKRHDPDGVVDP